MPRALYILIIGMAMNVTGASFLWPMNAIYVHEHLGKSLSIAGIVLMINSGASVVGNLVGGMWFDKIGGFKSIMLGIVITLTALIGLVFFHGWPHYAIFLAIIGFGTGIVFPVAYAYAGAIWPEGGRRAFNALYVAQNIGVAIGSALGGLVASYSFAFIFIANALLYVGFFLMISIGLKNVRVAKRIEKQNERPGTASIGSRASWNALVTLCVGYFLCWVSYVQWSTTIATYTQELTMTLKQYSLLWTINGALIVLAQPLLSAIVQRWMQKVKRQMLIGFAIFIVSFSILLKATSFFDFVLAMIVLTIAEMLVWPAIPTVANRLAPEGKEGFYQGFVNSTATAGRMVGPVLGGFIVDTAGIKPLFVALIIFSSLSFITTLLYDRKLNKCVNKEKQTVTMG
ncbi:MDR family MFS transporter [Thermaerobacillus caldiproteolyticus]|uniref:MFS family permease n=1 Tax=Thermaerobacillus caldiproteolyticus TaxID=247480 RepID=A0A7W0BXC6_9BACL|nr:MFS transporter [Anoxybacillus caldiproteolyticus]MBA2873878.1 MFS family permease [Anoxybacillus caldiproteolyticus]QPA30425.1 MFS transporter [Anoxybacillus caldiproteolyticus]